MRPRSESAPTISLSISFAAPACMRAGISSEKSSSRKSGMSAMSRVVRKAHVIFAHRAREPGFAARLRERAHPRDIGRAFRHADHTARLQHVEAMARLDALVIARQRQLAV